jgi:hypothetical protein
MMDNPVDINQFIVSMIEGSSRGIKLALADVTNEQLYYQPTADTNSIAWLVWHLSRWRDHVSALASGEPQVWVSEGWAQRWGLPSERTGVGDTPTQVATFRVAREELFGYLDAAHRVTVSRVAKLTPQQLAQPIEDLPGDIFPAWQALRRMCSDSMQHAGQINYLRGMMSGYGWSQMH